MSEEEKKAIKILKQLNDFDDLCDTCYHLKENCIGCRELAKDILINLIERLLKENKQLQEDLTTLEKLNGVLLGSFNNFDNTKARDLEPILEADYISVKIIEDTIEDLQKEVRECKEKEKEVFNFWHEKLFKTYYKMQGLQELLEKRNLK